MGRTTPRSLSIGALVEGWREWNRGSVDRKIFSAAVTVGVIAVVVAAGMVARELTIAAWYGTHDPVDAFLIAWALPNFVVWSLNGSFTSAVIPTFVQVRDTEGRAAAQRLLSQIMTMSLVLLAAIVVGLAFLGVWILPIMGSGFSEEKLLLTTRLFYILLPLIMIQGLASMWASILNAGERFAVAAISPVLEPITVVAAISLAGGAWGIYALAFSSTAGFTAQLILLGITLKRNGWNLRPRWRGMDKYSKQVAEQYFPMLAGTLLHNSCLLIDQAMAASLSAGSVAALSYGNKMVGGLQMVGSMALGTAVMPYFAGYVAAGNRDGLRKTFRNYTGLALLLTVPISVGVILFTEPITQFIFERGLFTAKDTQLVCRVQAMYMIEFPFFSITILGIRLLSATLRNDIFFKICLVNTVLNVALNYSLMRVMGVAGIALSTSLVYAFDAILIYYAIYRLALGPPDESSPIAPR